MFQGLPAHVQKLAVRRYEVFKENPFDPLLENEKLHDSRRGRHRADSHSVRIGPRYRAIYVVDNGPNGDRPDEFCWYWIGSHADYNTFTGSRRR